MGKSRVFLNPGRKLVDEVADWLCGGAGYPGRVRRGADGVHSLAHLLLVVPTAQSGRNLRLALARRAREKGWGGILPPLVSMPDLLLHPAGKRVATEAEELAVCAELLRQTDLHAFSALFPRPPGEKTLDWALDAARTILGIYSVLGEKGLLMREVDCPEDAARWRDLSGLEERFLAAFSARGVLPRCLARREAAAAGCVEPDVEEIVLPSAVDIPGAFTDYLVHSSCPATLLLHAFPEEADKFDAWGRPQGDFAASLPPGAIHPSPTPLEEADAIAAHFAAVAPSEAWPALVVCDADMHAALEGAFQNRFAEDELVLRNPSREPLAQTALGRLLVELLQLADRDDYESFSAFARSGDVARWAAAALKVDSAEIARAVGMLDAVQNAHLPRTLGEAITGTEDEEVRAHTNDERAALGRLLQLARLVEAKRTDPYGFLREIFASLVLDERNPSDRELVAAAEAVRALRADCASELIPESMRQPLFVRLLKRATYMQEPVAPNVLTAGGWLEVAWCPEDELVFAGFNEGCVPGDVVGHAFVPDALRQTLGVTTNASRAARDRYIFAQALRCRPAGAVSVHLHQLGSDASVTKPSRILFPCISDKDLPGLAKRLYTVAQGGSGRPARAFPDAWRLALPFPPPGKVFRESISATGIDAYKRCPFEFYLKEVFGEPADDRYRELDPRDFGTLCHEALRSFACSDLKDSADAKEIAAFLEREVRRRLSSFGTTLPAVVELQGEAAIARLGYFAQRQADRRAQGWRIVAAEQLLSGTFKDCPTRVRGQIDRIDRHETTGELAIIDYKTWRRADTDKMDSLQLPVYRALVEASGQYGPAAKNSRALYCILAERLEDTVFDEEDACHAGGQAEAENELVDILTRIARGIFYPPNRGDVWKNVYDRLIWNSPAEGVDPAWIADQAARLAAHKAEVEAHKS